MDTKSEFGVSGVRFTVTRGWIHENGCITVSEGSEVMCTASLPATPLV